MFSTRRESVMRSSAERAGGAKALIPFARSVRPSGVDLAARRDRGRVGAGDEAAGQAGRVRIDVVTLFPP